MEFLNAFSHLDWPLVLHLTGQHITLVGIAVTLAILVGVPLGILMTRFPSLAGPLQASATVLLTVPSIALFGLLLPFYSKFGQGLGPMPAITAVFLYSLLPIMRNTYLALTSVEPGIREAARGIGMTFGQRLRMVELPIAVPVILAGVRTAVVMNIGVMTIAATIGAGGLGVLILASISRSDMSMLIVGAVLVSVLAIIADLLLQVLQRSLTPKRTAQMIELQNLSKTFQSNGKDVKAVDSVSLTVNEGEICVFLGPSGCGKSTTLKMINRLIKPTSGKILINGEDTTGLDEVTLRRNIGYVIQQIGLFPNMTIEENIVVVPKLLGWDKQKCHDRARELMSMIKLEPKQYLHRYPRELSGGQQQRIGVIRALAADAPLLLMDEPFGAVDPINREMIQNEFFEMQRALNKTVIMVSHDIDEAIKLGDKIAIFRAGKLLQIDHPDTLLAHPADEFVSNFVGQDSTLKRLLLVKAEDAADNAPSVSPQTPVAEALELMDEHDRRYVVVTCTENRALGYVRRRDLHRQSGTCSQYQRDFNATAAYDEHLRILLSRMYEFNRSWLPVMDAERVFLGEVTQESIAEYLSSGKSRGGKTSIVSPAETAAA
ncbi:UNVERIFIED_ORG: glycine/betaine/L-proline transporter ATP-binding subunit [Pseudomonas reinekei]|nr:glycine/betaine/L-proline transporter ATP-binding subunit [Pseudomonas reinekei]